MCRSWSKSFGWSGGGSRRGSDDGQSRGVEGRVNAQSVVHDPAGIVIDGADDDQPLMVEVASDEVKDLALFNRAGDLIGRAGSEPAEGVIDYCGARRARESRKRGGGGDKGGGRCRDGGLEGGHGLG